jgi:hypothetical protein
LWLAHCSRVKDAPGPIQIIVTKNKIWQNCHILYFQPHYLRLTLKEGDCVWEQGAMGSIWT